MMCMLIFAIARREITRGQGIPKGLYLFYGEADETSVDSRVPIRNPRFGVSYSDLTGMVRIKILRLLRLLSQESR